ncbi:MAG: hypothetical protein R6U89_02510 [Dehalococcoidia bacterium]
MGIIKALVKISIIIILFWFVFRLGAVGSDPLCADTYCQVVNQMLDDVRELTHNLEKVLSEHENGR